MIRPQKRSALLRGAVVVCAMFSGGCAADYDLDMEMQTIPPTSVVLDDHVQINEGIAVAFIARPLDGGDVMDEETRIDLRSSDPSILRVEIVDNLSLRPDDGEWGFALWGASRGNTELTAFFDREEAVVIPVTVLPSR